MMRATLLLAIALAALAMLDRQMIDDARSLRERDSIVRPIVTPNPVVALELRPVGSETTWRFEKSAHWFYPDYHDAVADDRLVDQLIQSLTKGQCTIVNGPRARAALQLDRAQSLGITLFAADGSDWNAEIGRGVPRATSGECYARFADADTVYHLHTNPRALLGPWVGTTPSTPSSSAPAWTQIPLLDPRVLPRPLTRGLISEVHVHGGSATEPNHLLMIENASESRPNMPPEPPTITWYGADRGTSRRCVTGQALSYVQFLARLTFHSRFAPDTDIGSDGTHRLELTDTAGTVDVLELGGDAPDGGVFVRHRSSGSVYSIDRNKIVLMTPRRSALFDSLVGGTPEYHELEPTRR